MVSLEALEEVGPVIAGREPAALDLVQQLDLRRAVRRAIGELSEEQREVVILKEYQGLTFLEIAQALELPVSTVKTRLYRGLGQLRLRLEDEGIKSAAACPRRRAEDEGEGPGRTGVTMQCSRIQDEELAGQKLEVLYGEADAEVRASVASHLGECGACREEMASFRSSAAGPGGVDARRERAGRHRGDRRPLPVWLTAAAAALLFSGIGLGLALVGDTSGCAKTSPPRRLARSSGTASTRRRWRPCTAELAERSRPGSTAAKLPRPCRRPTCEEGIRRSEDAGRASRFRRASPTGAAGWRLGGGSTWRGWRRGSAISTDGRAGSWPGRTS